MWYMLAKESSRPRANFSPQDISDIIEFYNLGYSTIQLASHYGVSKTTIMAVLNKNKVVFRKWKRPINWTPEQIQYIITQYQNGRSANSLANLYGVSGHSITKILVQNNIALRTNYDKKTNIHFTDEQKNNIITMYNDGYSLNDIAGILDIKSPQAIQRVLDGFKINRRVDTLKQWNEEESKKITELFQEGKGIKEIAKILGVSPNSIHRFLMRDGIDISPRKGEEWWKWLASIEKSTQNGILSGIISRQFHLPQNTKYELWPQAAKTAFNKMLNKLNSTVPDPSRNKQIEPVNQN